MNSILIYVLLSGDVNVYETEIILNYYPILDIERIWNA